MLRFSLYILFVIWQLAAVTVTGYSVDHTHLSLSQKEIETNRILSDEDYSDNLDPTEPKHDGSSPAPASFTPIVMWHGMGDTGVGIKWGLNFIEKEMPGVYVKSLQIGSNIAKDMENGYFLNVNTQVDQVCKMIQNDTNLKDGYNGIGVSQGGQFLRAVAQRCPNPPMKNLISIGGQHQGIFGLPKCSAPKHEWCEIIDKLLTHLAYASWVQNFLVQAEYWHDPFKRDEYVENSVFIAEINNEKVKNPVYKANLMKLENLVLLKFEDETIVQPKESEWFGFYADGQDKVIVPLNESKLYQEDWIGLKAMNEVGKLHFLSSPGDHLQFSEKWFIKNILTPFLKK